MRPPALRVFVVLMLAAAASVAGCKVTVSAQKLASAAESSSAAAPPSAPGGHGRLTRISDEGRVTYSIRLRRCHLRDGGQLPDPRCTPGGVDPAITQANIDSTICRSGYTEKVRPPESETTRAKYDVAYPAYRVPSGDRSELDHLVSLELGGSNDITNLWPEVGPLPNPKDTVENTLRRAVCDHKVPLAAAQRAIATDWMTALARLGLR